MYDKAEYYSKKFIRNGIAGILFTALVISDAVTKQAVTPMVIILPILTIVWFYVGLRIKQKLKAKDRATEVYEITDTRITFKQIELLMSFIVVAILFISFRHGKYAEYLAFTCLAVYGFWFYKQMKAVNTYLKAS